MKKSIFSLSSLFHVFLFFSIFLFFGCKIFSSGDDQNKNPNSPEITPPETNPPETIKPFARLEDPIQEPAADYVIDFSKISFWDTDTGSGIPCGSYDSDSKLLRINTQWKAGVFYLNHFDASNYRYICLEYEPVKKEGEENLNLPFRIKVVYGDGSAEVQICERKRRKCYYRLKSDSKNDISSIQVWCITDRPIEYKINSLYFTQTKTFPEESLKAITDSGNKAFFDGEAKSAKEVVSEMGVGWNLGNTFDAHSYNWQENYWERGLEAEFDWEKTETDKELLSFVKNYFPNGKGYRTIRIPVTWYCHIIDDKYTIDPDWLACVKEIVDMALEEGYFVILNEHHSVHGDMVTTYKTQEGKTDEYDKRRMPSPLGYADGYIVSTNPQDQTESKAFLKAIWTQIARAFNNGYDYHLIFETMNEPRNTRDYHENAKSHEWQPALKLAWHKKDDGETIGGYWCDYRNCQTCIEEYEVLNEYNQICLETIRESGGNNEKRFVMIPGLCTGVETLLPFIENESTGVYAPGLFKMPKNHGQDDENLILTIHKYPQWKIDENPEKKFQKRMENDITNLFEELDKAFIQKGIPIVIGETGTGRSPISYEERIKWITHLAKKAHYYGMSMLWWEAGNREESSALIDRENRQFYEPSFVETMMSAYYDSPCK